MDTNVYLLCHIENFMKKILYYYIQVTQTNLIFNMFDFGKIYVKKLNLEFQYNHNLCLMLVNKQSLKKIGKYV